MIELTVSYVCLFHVQTTEEIFDCIKVNHENDANLLLKNV